jgi:hypothetical protein
MQLSESRFFRNKCAARVSVLLIFLKARSIMKQILFQRGVHDVNASYSGK